MPKFNSAIKLVRKYDNLVVCKSASKAYGLADSRIGYIISNEEIIKAYNIMALPFPFTKLSKDLFKYALDNNEIFEKSFLEIKETKKKFLEEIKDLKNVEILNTSLETPIFTIKIEGCKDLKQEFLNNNILVESCNEFEGLDKSFVRIRVGKEYKKLIEVIFQISKKYLEIDIIIK